MTGDRSRNAADFLTVACELGVLSVESAQRLANAATLGGISHEHLALKQGLLSAMQVDMVQTLQNPFDIIPGYEIQGVLGQGGMGVVYRARQLNLQRTVALKTVLLSVMTDPNTLARFEQEAVTVARLRHPNIITAFDFGRHSGRLYLVMELVEGEDLNALIGRNGFLNEMTAWGLARQCASGLAHAAQEGVVHRDIKPANLLLVKPPVGFNLPLGLPMVKIADFGLASLGADEEAQTRLTAANTTLGSPHYMAPEQLANSHVDLRADIYSLGITVFHMLTGSPPFSGQVTQIFSQKVQGNVPDIQTLQPNVSRASAELVARLTKTDPAQRPANYTELLERIDEVLQHVGGASLVSTNHSTNLSNTTAQNFPFVGNAANKTIFIGNKNPEWRAWLITALVTSIILIGGLWIVMQRQKAISKLGPNLISTGWREYLFRGSLKDWFAVSGQWGDAVDDDGAKVLAGSSGSVRRELWRLADDQRLPLENYRVTLGVCLNEASAVEVQFGLLNANRLDVPRSVCRIQRDGNVWLATRETDASTLTVPSSARNWSIGPDRYHSVMLERFEKLWRVTIDDQLVGEVSGGDFSQRSEFRLAVESGPAWFSDLEVEEFAMKSSLSK